MIHYLSDIVKMSEKKTKKSFSTIIESPKEIQKQIIGLELCGFEINTGVDDAYCNEVEEIYMDFQGKEMRIFINEDGKLQVYTD